MSAGIGSSSFAITENWTRDSIIYSLNYNRNLPFPKSATEEWERKASICDLLLFLKPIIRSEDRDIRLLKIFNKTLKFMNELKGEVPDTETLSPFPITQEAKLNRQIFLCDYKPPKFTIQHLFLEFDIQETYVIVSAKMTVDNNLEWKREKHLTLHGKNLELLEVKVDGKILNPKEYQSNPNYLKIFQVPSDRSFLLETICRIDPFHNSEQAGLYQGGKGLLNTQCEPEGFRAITYFLDRPDVMPAITTSITACKKTYPTLLCNGNEVIREEYTNTGRHTAIFHDPNPKPTYLFALLAGDMACVETSYQPSDPAKPPVILRLYTEKGNEGRAKYPLEILKESMLWDEKQYGRFYDLEVLNMVAIPKFPTGAMENKGCLFFNSSLLLCSPETATDDNFKGVIETVAHEYFHNWTGNRVTLQQWLYLFFKEGLTSFRHRQFYEDYYDKGVARIEHVRNLRSKQFPEDAGPTAHPVLKKSMECVANLYTYTTYDKGAEIFRMLRTLLGRVDFRKGMDAYFQDCDGKAVTSEDFIKSIEKATGKDLKKFRNWFNQAGTPHVAASMRYNREKKEVVLEIAQSCRETPECNNKKPFLIPIKIGFLDSSGNDMLSEEKSLLWLSEAKQSYTFSDIQHLPVPVFLKDFSAPVILHYPYSIEDLALIATGEDDPVSRYDAIERIYRISLNECYDWIKHQKNNEDELWKEIAGILECILSDESLSPALKAALLQPPSLHAWLSEREVFDVNNGKLAYYLLKKVISAQLLEQFESSFYDAQVELEKIDSESVTPYSIGLRKLRKVCLDFIMEFDPELGYEMAAKIYRSPKNLTDRVDSLQILQHCSPQDAKWAMNDFYHLWQKDPVTMNEAIGFWFSIQASARTVDYDALESALDNAAFDWQNPSRLKAVFLTFGNNLINFHDPSGDGYKFFFKHFRTIAAKNEPFAASYLASVFSMVGKLPQPQKTLLEKELHAFKELNLKGPMNEILSKLL